MDNQVKNALKIAGSVGMLAATEIIFPGASTVTKGVAVAAGFEGGDFCKDVIKAVFGNFTHQFANKIDTKRLIEGFKNDNQELNHDIEKLMLSCLPKSIEHLKNSYLASNPYKNKFVRDTLDSLVADAKIDTETIKDYALMATDQDAWLNQIHDYIFRGQTDHEGELAEIETFFKRNLPATFSFTFIEGLKNPKDEKPLKAFLIKTLNGLNDQANQNAEIQEKILTEIKNLRDNKPNKTVAQSRAYFEKVFEQLTRIEGKIDIIEENTNKILTKIETLKPETTHLPKELTLKLPKIHPSEVIGREDELEHLHQLLFDNKHVVVVNGLGGIGKTTLAQAYLSLHYDDYQHIAWISQSDAQALASDFVNVEGLKENLNIATEGKDIDTLFKEILNNLKALTDKPNLLLIDNAESSLTHHVDWLPQQPNWHLLVTSRATIEKFHQKELGFLNPEKALALFKTHCQWIKDEEVIKELLQLIDYHTLTIEILAKTAQKQHTSPNVLKTVLEKDLKANVFVKHKGDKIEKVMTYLASIFDLSRLNPHEAWLMKQFACLPPEFVNYYSLLELIAPEGEHEENFAETLAELVSKGWLLTNTETDSYKMHRIIAEVVKQKLGITLNEVANLIDTTTEKLYIDQTKDNPVDKFQWIPYGKAILANFDEETAPEIATLQNNLALVLETLGDYQGAKKLLEKAKISNEKNFREEHPNTAASYLNLATVLKKLGDYKGAKKLLEKAKESDEKNFGEEHPITAKTYSNLALVLKDLRDYEGAKKLLEKATISNEKNFGEEHPTTAIFYSNLGIVLQDLRDYEGAKKLLEKATISNEKNFREEHPNTGKSYFNLGMVLFDMKEFEKAVILVEKAYNIYKKLLGEQHPDTQHFKRNLDFKRDNQE